MRAALTKATDRQTYRQTGRLTNTHTYRETGKVMAVDDIADMPKIIRMFVECGTLTLS